MKVKKILSTAALAIVIALSALMLFACGGVSSDEVYRNFVEVFETVNADSTTFENSTIQGLKSKFYVKDLCYKTSTGSKVYAYTTHTTISAGALNFVEKYYPTLQDYDGKGNFGDISNALNAFSNSYEALKEEHEEILALPESANYIVYNGFFAKYRLQFNDFVEKSVGLANTLSTFLNDYAKVAVIEGEEIDAGAFETFMDIQNLKILNDYKNFYMTSCRGLNISSNEFLMANNTYFRFLNNVASKSVKSPSTTERKMIKDLFDRLAISREDAQNAINNFSLYDYANDYDFSLDAYVKTNENAKIHYNELAKYFWENKNIMSLLVDYLMENAVA